MYKAKCIWFTGLPCAGKTTLALALKKYIPNCMHLDGDYMRATALGKNVGFSPEDRRNHLLRMGTIAKLAVDSGVTVLCSFVSPSREVRDEVRGMFGVGEFVEVFLDPGLAVCEARDVKGMYAKARAGEIKNFTGIDAPYEAPEAADIGLNTSMLSIDECVGWLTHLLYLFPPRASFCFGRWNGIFHNGHDHIIRELLKKNRPVILGVRNVQPDEKNPWTAVEVKEMLDYRFMHHDDVHVMIVPDIASVEYGRNVGYEVNEIEVTKEIAAISGTRCREMIDSKDDTWKKLVPPLVVEFLEKKYGTIS